MTKEPNLLNEDEFVLQLIEAEAMGKQYVLALNEQRKRQQERLGIVQKINKEEDIQYLRVKLSNTANPKLRDKLAKQIKLLDDAAKLASPDLTDDDD